MPRCSKSTGNRNATTATHIQYPTMWGKLTDQALDPRTILPGLGIVASVKKGESVVAAPNNVRLIILPVMHNLQLGRPHIERRRPKPPNMIADNVLTSTFLDLSQSGQIPAMLPGETECRQGVRNLEYARYVASQSAA